LCKNFRCLKKYIPKNETLKKWVQKNSQKFAILSYQSLLPVTSRFLSRKLVKSIPLILAGEESLTFGQMIFRRPDVKS
uniref:Uncharacterized protein n=1 Tax=Romanomermis culicivorax TaxID=13658 RepID=A0A915JHE9_ROMCU